MEPTAWTLRALAAAWLLLVATAAGAQDANITQPDRRPRAHCSQRSRS